MRKKRVTLWSTVFLLLFSWSSIVYASENDSRDIENKLESVRESDDEKIVEENENMNTSDEKEDPSGQTDLENNDIENDLSIVLDTDARDNDIAPQDNVKRPYGWYFDIQDNHWYFYDYQGNKVWGWQKIGDKWYYMDGADAQNPGVMIADCKKTIGNEIYFFDRSGAMQTGWVYRRGEGWYYTDSSGAMSMGWKYINGKWYYLDPKNVNNPGLMVANCRMEVYGVPYFFNGSGAMEVGWVYRRGEGYYYTNRSGAQVMGWQKDGRKWYYLNPSNAQYPGLMLANCEMNIGGFPYGFDKSGAMWAGWIKKADGWRYYDEYSGQSVRGWKRVSGQWYYMDPSTDNRMISGGWKKIGSLNYFFKSDGSMATGWLKSSGYWYYLGSDGGARTGWKVVDGNWYYFYPGTNKMATNTIVDGIHVRSDGKMAKTATVTARLNWLFPNGLPTTAEQMAPYLTTIVVPIIDANGNSGTMTLTIHKKLVNEVTAVFRELKAIGFPVRQIDTAAYNWRNMAAGSSRSHHSYGCVVDLNWNSNPMIGMTGGSYRPGIDPYSVTTKAVQIWKNHGFYWGGDWKSTKDYMHFTYTNH